MVKVPEVATAIAEVAYNEQEGFLEVSGHLDPHPQGGSGVWGASSSGEPGGESTCDQHMPAPSEDSEGVVTSPSRPKRYCLTPHILWTK